MGADSSGAAARQKRRAILFVLGSSATFTLSAALVKAAGTGIPTLEAMAFRNVGALMIALPLAMRAGWTVLRTRRPLSHAWRVAAGLGGTFGTYYGYANLPLAAATALTFAMPLCLALMSIPLLHERPSAGRLLAIAAGLLGVLLVVRPWQGARGLPLAGSGIVLAGVVAWALSMVSIRRMGQTGERNLTIVLWYTLAGTLASTAMAVPVWVTPAPVLWPVLLSVGLVSGVAQLLMTEGYRNGEASMLAPFEYSAIIYTIVLGWAVWGELPGVWESCGIVVLVLSGLLSWWREGRE